MKILLACVVSLYSHSIVCILNLQDVINQSEWLGPMLALGLRSRGGGGWKIASPSKIFLGECWFKRGILISCDIKRQLFTKQVFPTGVRYSRMQFLNCRIVEKSIIWQSCHLMRTLAWTYAPSPKFSLLVKFNCHFSLVATTGCNIQYSFLQQI